MKGLRLFFILLLLKQSALAATISGQVKDEQGRALDQVIVKLPALKIAAISNDKGEFTFKNLEHGIYVLEFNRIGYAPIAKKLELHQDSAQIQAQLQESMIVLPTLTVSAKPQPSSLLTSAQSVSVLNQRDLARVRGGNVMDAIKNVPGSDTFTTGAGVVKPVVRGLSSARVLVVENGSRQEDQQWGDEHDSKIDGLDTERIEVLRGPSSLLYGSDALGGVINITRTSLPSSDQGDARLSGELNYNGSTHNNQNAGAVSLSGASGIFGYRAQYSAKQTSNYKTPSATIANSAGKDNNASVSVGATAAWGAVRLDASSLDQRTEIPDQDPQVSAYQKVNHDKVAAHVNVNSHWARLEALAAYQVNGRKEFEQKSAESPALNLWLRTTSLDLKAHHHPVGNLSGSVGLSLLRQTNQTLGQEALIPSYNAGNLGAFIFEELALGRFTFSAGARGDWKQMDVHNNESLSVVAQQKNYSSFSGALGAVFHAADPLAFAVNLGRGYRAPTAFELFSNGVHEGSGRYEIGDANLKPEESLNVDVSARWASKRLKAEVTFFRNQIQRFIYLDRLTSGVNPLIGQNIGDNQVDDNGNPVLDNDGNPVTVSANDPESESPIFLTRQADAVLLGGEFDLEFQANDWLILSSGFDLIRGTNEQLNQPLPFVPANRVKLGARLQRAKLWKLAQPYFELDSKMVDTQNRLASGETVTSGYTLWNLSLGTEVYIFGNRTLIDFGIENLFDREYVDHLSRTKSFASAPSRSFTFKITVPFDIIK